MPQNYPFTTTIVQEKFENLTQLDTDNNYIFKAQSAFIGSNPS